MTCESNKKWNINFQKEKQRLLNFSQTFQNFIVEKRIECKYIPDDVYYNFGWESDVNLKQYLLVDNSENFRNELNRKLEELGNKKGDIFCESYFFINIYSLLKNNKSKQNI